MFGVSWFVGIGVSFFVYVMVYVVGLIVVWNSVSCCMFCCVVSSVSFRCFSFYVG